VTGDHRADRGAQRRALSFALAANTVFLVVELVGGVVFHALILVADAVHLLSDVGALAVALLALRLLDRPASARHSYGLQRAEVLGAQVNSLILVGVSGWIAYEAIRRLGQPGDVSGGGLLGVAIVGLVVNATSVVVLARAAGHSLNMRGAMLHMASDVAGSVAAIATGVAVIVWDATWVDPIASLVVVGLVLWSVWGLLRDTTHVLMEGTPRGTDPVVVETALAAEPGVDGVHHLHLWNLASDVPALSAHVVLVGQPTLHEAQGSADALKAMLEERYGIAHVTLELECHGCDTPTHESPAEVAAGASRTQPARPAPVGSRKHLGDA